eukprot:10597721-Karenia_brevis.AAC.1
MEYNLIAKVIEMFMSFDQLAVQNLAGIERLVRRFQLIEEKYKHRLPQADNSGITAESDSSLFLGLGSSSSFGRQSICVMLELSEYIGEELQKEASISKGK